MTRSPKPFRELCMRERWVYQAEVVSVSFRSAESHGTGTSIAPHRLTLNTALGPRDGATSNTEASRRHVPTLAVAAATALEKTFVTL